MRRVLPSLPALTVFEASARHTSFTRAAEELNLTQSAVSKQVRGLEEFLGVQLFERVRQRIVLTEAGRGYLKSVREALEIMEAATMEALAFQGGGGILNIATLPTFGTRWLAPRLGDFTRRYPKIALNLTARAWPFDLVEENLDVAIFFGDAPWPGGICDRLMGETVVAVASPSLLAPNGPVRQPRDLAKVNLLHHRARPRAWQEWLGSVGADKVNAFHGLRFEQFEMIIQAAVSGVGFAMVPRFMIEHELAAGQLVIPFDHKPDDGPEAYYLVYAERKRTLPAVMAFRNWILEQANG
ncbi:MAG: transcriptional regulator GcvA [Rhodospirillaceae bacterium]|nr:transcriptional regulator GcvA [Rhodospirillaceae bacterium]